MQAMTLHLAGSGMNTAIIFGLLVGLAIFLVWLALSPARRPREMETRLDAYVERDLVQEEEMARSFIRRVLFPLLRQSLSVLGGLMPQRNLEKTARLLVRAGEPAGLTALDFLGLRLLAAITLGGLVFLWQSGGFFEVLRNALLAASAGLFLPQFWLRHYARKRQHRIRRALPDALDMLTVGVEAGLAFESALLRVGDQWRNPLTQEFRHVVTEMRMGVSRSEAFQRMAHRAGVDELSTFVAVLVQSTELGISVAQVLHAQADQMRITRRQRGEELARQASVKMIMVLAIFIFPVMFIVTLGPVAPEILNFFSNSTGK